MMTVKYPVALVAVVLWIGFVCAISFMEAWLKFRAPGVTVPLGLGIGRLVFGALNKVEWVLALVTAANLLFFGGASWRSSYVFLLVPVVLLILQTFWLLPALDARAELHIQGLPVRQSALHLYFIGAEVIKVVCLALFSISLFEKMIPLE